MSASLSALNPRFRRVAQQFVAYARRLDATLVVTSTRRTMAEQAALYARFIAGKSGGIPAAPPGRSKHGLGLAFDLAPYNRPALGDPALHQLGALWRQLGGEWNASDPVHFAVPGDIDQLARQVKSR